MTNEEYVKMQNMWLNATGVKKGDWVKVTRAAEDHESGWLCNWCTTPMDKCVGKTVRVVDIYKNYGLQLDIGCDESDESNDYWCFPFFVLEPAEKPGLEKYTFTPFEQVLTRNYNSDNWTANLFSYIEDGIFACTDAFWTQCIPYAGHEHLIGTSDEPEDWVKYYDKE